MNRRQFLLSTAAAGVAGLAAPFCLRAAVAEPVNGRHCDELLRGLLRDWCDALIRLQFTDPRQPETYGAFHCPACGFIHGRCGDAVQPLLVMAAQAGETRYLEAALRVAAWTKNVDQPDGSWTNELDPKSWKGTTVFAAIAFAEALEWHGDLLEDQTRGVWRDRLKRAGEFILSNFNLEYGNINYGVSGAYALALLGKLLDEARFCESGKKLAHEVLGRFTPQNRLLFGEGHPATRRSPKGCYAVDIGYNVEESLPNLVHYALLTGDKEVLEAALASIQTHLKFMLPDGAWDNSWGTRSFKWTYWGSRTSDGCLAAFTRLVARDSVLATAAIRHAGLLRACTHEGLLHGGPHYASHGVKPCVHHTFAHAKSVAGALHYCAEWKDISELPALPRAAAQGVEHFPEIEVSLAAIGPWRATFSGYDWMYRPDVFQASGGAPGILWHEKVGLVLSASLARYVRVEANNMQLAPEGEDFPLTVRVEQRTPEGGWFTNLHDATAIIRDESTAGILRFRVETQLLSAEQKTPPVGPCRFEIIYTLAKEKVTVSARGMNPLTSDWSLVIPVIAKSDEATRQVAPNRWEITKPAGRLLVAADTDMVRIPSRRDRVFNLVPGLEALSLQVVGSGSKPVSCTLQFMA